MLVTHDRYFMDQVCNEVLYLHEGGLTRFSGLAQWEAHRQSAGNKARSQDSKSKSAAVSDNTNSLAGSANASGANSSTSFAPTISSSPGEPLKTKKLSYKEQREFEGMEKTIESLESELSDLMGVSGAGEGIDAQKKRFQRIAELQSQVEKLYARWSELEARTK